MSDLASRWLQMRRRLRALSSETLSFMTFILHPPTLKTSTWAMASSLKTGQTRFWEMSTPSTMLLSRGNGKSHGQVITVFGSKPSAWLGTTTSKTATFTSKGCTFSHTGGSGFVPNRCRDVVVEHCVFNHTGSSVDERMWKRGSGTWPFKCERVLIQNNRLMNAHGPQGFLQCPHRLRQQRCGHSIQFELQQRGRLR